MPRTLLYVIHPTYEIESFGFLSLCARLKPLLAWKKRSGHLCPHAGVLQLRLQLPLSSWAYLRVVLRIKNPRNESLKPKTVGNTIKFNATSEIQTLEIVLAIHVRL